MNPEIDKLINLALTDRQVTDREREIILRKAEKLGLDIDEVEMYLEGKIGVSSFSENLTHDLQEDLNEVTIGNQIWMSKNLNVDKFRNGDPIPYAKYEEDWLEAQKNRTPACGYYDNNPNNGLKFGKIFNRNALFDERGLAPEGWKIPTIEDWKILINYLGGENVAGEKMKSNSDNWLDFGFGDGCSGFNAEPGGIGYDDVYVDPYDPMRPEKLVPIFYFKFKGIGKISGFASSSTNINKYGDILKISCFIDNNSKKIKFNETFNEALYVRCIKIQ